MNSLKSTASMQYLPASSVKLDYADIAAEHEVPVTAVSKKTMDQLSEQIRANLIRNVAECKKRSVDDPADWEI